MFIESIPSLLSSRVTATPLTGPQFPLTNNDLRNMYQEVPNRVLAHLVAQLDKRTKKSSRRKKYRFYLKVPMTLETDPRTRFWVLS